MGQVGPRWAKMAPKLFQESSKILQDGQRCHIWEVSWKFLVPRCARDGPKWLRLTQDSPKLIQKAPITAPRRGRLGQDSPRLLPSCSNKIPKSLEMATYELRWFQDGSAWHKILQAVCFLHCPWHDIEACKTSLTFLTCTDRSIVGDDIWYHISVASLPREQVPAATARTSHRH